MLCDKCQEKPREWKVPYLWKEGENTKQYYVCNECKKKEEVMLKSDRKDKLNNQWVKIK